jgi:hypothetical protein
MIKVESTCIEPAQDNGYWFCEDGHYPEDSVLAGQDAHCKVKWYATLEEAAEAHPEAEIQVYAYPREPVILPDCSPAGFDPAYAGETWNEEEEYGYGTQKGFD